MLIKVFCFLLFFFGIFINVETTEKQCDFIPNFSGTLLELNFTNEQPGSAVVQPYFYGGYSYGDFDNNWSLNRTIQYGSFGPQITAYFGLSKAIELDLIFGARTIFFKGRTSTGMDDSIAGLAYQCLWDDKNTYTPNLRFIFYGIFPTGQFERLDSFFEGFDATGAGSFGNQFGVAINKNFYINPCHPFNLSFNFIYTYLYNNKVQGLNAYGGGPHTNIKVSPGASVLTTISLEYMLTSSLFFVLDVQYIHVFKTRYSGYLGSNLDGSPTFIQTNPKDAIVMAPALEVNFNKNLTAYLGAFLFPYGRNTVAAAEGTFVLCYNF